MDAVLQISANVNKELFEKIRGEESMCEALRELMADDLKNAEEKGLTQGIAQGADKHIIELVCKKIAKGKSVEVIASEIEEETDKVQKIYDIAKKFAPNYNVDAIYNEMQ